MLKFRLNFAIRELGFIGEILLLVSAIVFHGTNHVSNDTRVLLGLVQMLKDKVFVII